MPFSIFKKLAEERIREAMERGEFNDLELKGKPVELKEDPFVPEELRIAYRMLKNAGFLPKEVELRKEIAELEAYLDEEHQDAYGKIKKLSALLFHLNQIRSKPLQVEDEEYYAKIVEKIRIYKKEAFPKERKEPQKIDFSKLQTLLSVKSFYRKKR
ncbi:molecular chaperone DnaJ [Caldimicrobium thiodismutans]|uniref:Molecular chaperone DnaJ n=1 Tax=Caldimicrobium thiodismutans TaxID=1653476 RepID=A0A0U5ARI2_9BACT|nr:DUF1992 domain-containing protein [Caldimicrobium thiodismutans]BAU23505.1 molecular chaperone DnaJ [Caldimicrobium thiodismutans]